MLPINLKATYAMLSRLERESAQIMDDESTSISQTDDWPRPGMGEEFVDTGPYYVKRVRGRPAALGTPLWLRRFEQWRKFGFTVEEATWAADKNLSLQDPYVRDIQRGRLMVVRSYVEDFGISFEEAVRRQADILMRKNQRYRESQENIFNVFREISP